MQRLCMSQHAPSSALHRGCVDGVLHWGYALKLISCSGHYIWVLALQISMHVQMLAPFFPSSCKCIYRHTLS